MPPDTSPFLLPPDIGKGTAAGEIREVPSPYAGRTLSLWDQIALSAYWFATNFLWGALLVIMLPDEAKAMAPAYRVTALGFMTGVSAIVALVVPLVVGALSDRCTSRLGRRRPYLIGGVLINLLGLGLMAVAYWNRVPVTGPANIGYWQTISRLLENGSFTLFLLAYMVVQFGNNIASAAYSGLIPDLVPYDQRGRASGYMALMSQLGTLFGGLVCGMLIHARKDASSAEIASNEMVRYGALGIALVGVALITVLGVKENPLSVPPPRIHWPTYVRSLWIDPRRYPDFAWVWMTRALVMLGFYSVLPFVNYYFLDVIRVRPEDVSKTASLFMGVVLLTSSVSGIYGGYLSDRIGRKKVVYVANSSIAVMAVLFIFCHSQATALTVGALFGLGFGAYTSVDWALGTDVLPTKHNAAKEMAVWHIAMTLPQSIAAPIASYVIGVFGSTVREGGPDGIVVHYTIQGYSAVFLFAAVCFASGAYLLKNVRNAR